MTTVRAEIAESSFEYLLCEILALDPPSTQEIEQVSICYSISLRSIQDSNSITQRLENLGYDVGFR